MNEAEFGNNFMSTLTTVLFRVEKHMNGKPPTLEQMTEAVFTRRQELSGRMSEALVGEAHGETLVQQTLPCPHCGRRLPAQGPHPRTVETRVGPVRLSRPYFYCLRCQEGFYPLDEVLRLAERETASKLFETLTGLVSVTH